MKRTTGDKGPGKDKVRISTTIRHATDADLRRLAAASGLTRCAMARECITDAVTRGLTVTRATRHAGAPVDYADHAPATTLRAADDPPKNNFKKPLDS